MNNSKIKNIYNALVNDTTLKSVFDSYDTSKPIKVLVFCYVYNHSKYLNKCLESILGQKVNFNVKILIHNDNSTDSSLKIIENYQNKYPKVIEVVSQKENLYDRNHGLLPIFMHLRKYHEGKYIAMCEGDDYWSNPFKLAFQSTIMDKFESLSFCVHKVDVLNENSQQIVRCLPSRKLHLKSGVIKPNKFMSILSKKYPFQTSSYFFKTNDFSSYLDNLPEFAKIMPTEDESLLLYFGQLGNSYYYNKTMSIYRKFSVGSWSNEQKQLAVEQNNKRLTKMIEAVEAFDKYTNNIFHKMTKKRVIKDKFMILCNQEKYDEIYHNKDLKRYFLKKYPKDYLAKKIRMIIKRGKNNAQ